MSPSPVPPSESNITVSLSSNSSEVLEGAVIQLSCSVGSTTGPLSVVWHRADQQGAGPDLEVASFHRDGTVVHSPSYRERSDYGEVRVEKLQADAFSLSLYNALPGDEAQYRCTATEWLQTGTEPELNWEKIGETSATKAVTVKTVVKTKMPGRASCYQLIRFRVSGGDGDRDGDGGKEERRSEMRDGMRGESYCLFENDVPGQQPRLDRETLIIRPEGHPGGGTEDGGRRTERGTERGRGTETKRRGADGENLASSFLLMLDREFFLEMITDPHILR
ncbi:Immunoglobulin superfamily member 3 [Liparis tanakae]|nr:Immunoglobulin superfamily member 3 [Liparis tanakae]